MQLNKTGMKENPLIKTTGAFVTKSEKGGDARIFIGDITKPQRMSGSRGIQCQYPGKRRLGDQSLT